MIVRPHGHDRLLITQPDHAALAGRIMHAWREPALLDSPRRAAILLAVAEHDNGWRETDEAVLLDGTGHILDFIAIPAAERQAVWPRGVARLEAVPYAAALVAQHAVHVYSRFRGDPEWDPFFASMEGLRDEHLRRASPATLPDLLADYQFVRVGDLISLVFCNAWTEPQQDGFGRTITLDASRVIVKPDPFEGRSAPIEITARVIAADSFPSVDAARDAIARAPERRLTGMAVGR